MGTLPDKPALMPCCVTALVTTSDRAYLDWRLDLVQKAFVSFAI